jgi:hypothetical protein
MRDLSKFKKMKEQLIEICKKPEYLMAGDHIVVKEPYIPYIPEHWNGVLVLFEAQNLSGFNDGNECYKNDIQNDPYNRLGNRDLKKEGIGITPWDEGWLDLPLKYVFPKYELSEYAVGNAVLWSLSKSGKNINPTKVLKDESKKLWKEFLALMRPKLIIRVGSVARDVITGKVYAGQRIHLFFPYGQYPSFVEKHFNFNDFEESKEIKSIQEQLIKKFPEKENVYMKSIPLAISLKQKYEKNK